MGVEAEGDKNRGSGLSNMLMTSNFNALETLVEFTGCVEASNHQRVQEARKTSSSGVSGHFQKKPLL